MADELQREEVDGISAQYGRMRVKVTGRDVMMLVATGALMWFVGWTLHTQHLQALEQHQTLEKLWRASIYVHVAPQAERDEMYRQMDMPDEIRRMQHASRKGYER